ncbi:hypothetical protein MHM582_2067 [Microbacterium sp. HM58-2]|nr:hypothetical protein MHM582_2067 [Microbacterium sp. HM58-2]
MAERMPKAVEGIAGVLAEHTITEAANGGAECECGQWSGPWSGCEPERHQARMILAEIAADEHGSETTRCPGCDLDPVGYAPHNGKGDCPPKREIRRRDHE